MSATKTLLIRNYYLSKHKPEERFEFAVVPLTPETIAHINAAIVAAQGHYQRQEATRTPGLTDPFMTRCYFFRHLGGKVFYCNRELLKEADVSLSGINSPKEEPRGWIVIDRDLSDLEEKTTLYTSGASLMLSVTNWDLTLYNSPEYGIWSQLISETVPAFLLNREVGEPLLLTPTLWEKNKCKP